MEYTQLSPLEIRDLINQYRSDLRKLHFQTIKVQSIIKELENYVTEAEEALAIDEAKIHELPAASEVIGAKESDASTSQPSETPKPKSKPKKKRRGRPKGSKNKSTTKSKSVTKSKRGPGRPPKKKQEKSGSGKKGRPAGRLSDWDQFVLQSLENKKQALTTSDFAAIAVADSSIKSGEAQIKVKLNRSLHKLANTKGMLSKVDYSGRGFAYALKSWLDSKGKLPKKYEHK